MGVQFGGQLLIHAVERILEPMETWLKENSRNKGGRPKDLRRRFIIDRLARAAPDVISARATATAGGLFTNLCGDVFGAYKLSTIGIADVIEDVVRDLNGEVGGQ